MNYKGYKYTEFRDRDEDKDWYVHSITYEGNNGLGEVPVDYSRYSKMTYLAFILLVDLNFPERPKGRVTIPWDESRLLNYKIEIEYTKNYTLQNDRLSHL